MREARAALRQDDDARAAAAVVGAVHHPLAAVAADREQPGGAELDRAAAEHRVAHPAGDAAEQRVGEVGHLGRDAGRGLALAGAERLPAAEQRVLLGRERRPLLPAPPHLLGLRHVAGGALLVLPQRVVLVLVGLLLVALLLPGAFLRLLPLGLLAQRARVLAELVGGGRAALRLCRQRRETEQRCADDPAERTCVHGDSSTVPPRRQCAPRGYAVLGGLPLPGRYRHRLRDARHRADAV